MTTQTSQTTRTTTTDKIIIKPQGDHINQWSHLKQLFVSRRMSDAGRDRKAIPRTTNRDVAQLVNYWHMEYRRVAMRGFPALDKSKSSRGKWVNAKTKVDKQLAAADPAAVFPDNEWFWQDATKELAIYLESLKVVPSRTEIAVDAVTETVAEHAETVKDAVKKAAEGSGLIDALKTGALIIGGALGLVIVIPAIARAFRD